MTSKASTLHDPVIVKGVINVALDHPELIPEIVAATGTTAEEVAIPQLAEVLLALADFHSRGLRPDIESLASHLAERSTRYDDREGWLDVLKDIRGKGWIEGLPAYLDRLRSLRFRRSLVRVSEAAQNGCANGDLISSVEAAIADLKSSSAVEPLPKLDQCAELPPAPEPLVGTEKEQLLIPGELDGIASDSGVGKTNLLCAVAEGIASGRDVLGFKCQQRSVLYVTSDGEPDLARRLRRLWEGLTGESRIPSDLPLHAFSDDAFNLDHDSDFARVRKSLEDLGARRVPAVFLLESLATNVSDPDVLKDQVQFRDYARRRFRALMTDFPGLTIAVSAHLRKPQQGGANDLGTRVAGSMQIRAGLDCIIGLIPSGRDAFTVRRVKRSRSGGDFEAFKVRILGARTEPLRLVNDGPTVVSVEEARGAAGAVLAFLRAAGGRKSLKDIKSGVTTYRTRAVEDACKRLSEGERPRLVRVSQKPAVYELVPEQVDLDLEDLI